MGKDPQQRKNGRGRGPRVLLLRLLLLPHCLLPLLPHCLLLGPNQFFLLLQPLLSLFRPPPLLLVPLPLLPPLLLPPLQLPPPPPLRPLLSRPPQHPPTPPLPPPLLPLPLHLLPPHPSPPTLLRSQPLSPPHPSAQNRPFLQSEGGWASQTRTRRWGRGRRTKGKRKNKEKRREEKTEKRKERRRGKRKSLGQARTGKVCQTWNCCQEGLRSPISAMLGGRLRKLHSVSRVDLAISFLFSLFCFLSVSYPLSVCFLFPYPLHSYSFPFVSV
mmetsp:Transcript_8090/g.12244  ORF Transcript_8090/g.12244 Transcript_8090/m.12244 type:complete len:272 (-) Transcript_8090:147-962(-)